jgi:hypothetical protein
MKLFLLTIYEDWDQYGHKNLRHNKPPLILLILGVVSQQILRKLVKPPTEINKNAQATPVVHLKSPQV